MVSLYLKNKIKLKGARMPFYNDLYPTNWTGYFYGELTPVGKR